MRRIAVVGTTGSGKTTLARELSARLRIPFIEEDAILWGPNWTEAPREVRLERISEALRSEAWVREAYAALFARSEYAHLAVIRLRSPDEVHARRSGSPLRPAGAPARTPA